MLPKEHHRPQHQNKCRALSHSKLVADPTANTSPNFECPILEAADAAAPLVASVYVWAVAALQDVWVLWLLQEAWVQVATLAALAEASLQVYVWAVAALQEVFDRSQTGIDHWRLLE